METTQISFRESPKFQKGRSGEKLVAGLLKQKGWFVIPSYDYSGEDGDKAPKLEGLREGFPVPDLDIAKDGTRRWAEVKTKASAIYTRITKRLEHGIPLRHYRSYQKVQKVTGCEVWLFVCEEDTGEVLCAKLDYLQCHARIYDGSKMSRGGMAFFPRDAFQVFKAEMPS